ncbi:hypothetical protein P8452_76992 [Trifolium repens]|nr:hypothetical protein P8452_76992 [Trifolium repens]
MKEKKTRNIHHARIHRIFTSPHLPLSPTATLHLSSSSKSVAASQSPYLPLHRPRSSHTQSVKRFLFSLSLTEMRKFLVPRANIENVNVVQPEAEVEEPEAEVEEPPPR